MIASLLPYRWIAIALLAAAAVGFMGIQQARISGLRADLAKEQAGRAQDREERERAALAASERNRLEEQRRAAAQKDATDESQRLAQRARSDAAGAAAARERVLVAAASASGGRAALPDPGVTASCPAAEPPDLVQHQLLEWATGRVVELGAALDAAHIAGELCVKSYDALRPESVAP